MPATAAQIVDALHAACVAASGLSAASVLWGNQDRNQPALPYVALYLLTPRAVGVDYLTQTQVLTDPLGTEIKQTTTGLREFTLSIEVHAAPVITSSTASDARDLAERVRAGLLLSSVRAGLRAVGVSAFDTSAPLQVLPGLVSQGYRGRAVLDVRCYAPAIAVTEAVGYITSTRITPTLSPTGAGGAPFVAP